MSRVNCIISDSAGQKLEEILAAEEDKELRFRVFVAHAHGDHAHYGLGLDYPKDTDELVETAFGIPVLLEKGQDFLDGVEIDYDASSDEWTVINARLGGHHHGGDDDEHPHEE